MAIIVYDACMNVSVRNDRWVYILVMLCGPRIQLELLGYVREADGFWRLASLYTN